MASQNPFEDFRKLLELDLQSQKESEAKALEEHIKQERRKFKGTLNEGDFQDIRNYIESFESQEQLEAYAPFRDGSPLSGMLHILPDNGDINLNVLQLLHEKFPMLFTGEKGEKFRKFLDSEYAPFNHSKNKKAIMEWTSHVMPKNIFEAVLSSSIVLEDFFKKEENKKQVKNTQEKEGCVYNALAYAIDLYEFDTASSHSDFLKNVEILIKLDPELLKWRNGFNESILMIASRRGSP